MDALIKSRWQSFAYWAAVTIILLTAARLEIVSAGQESQTIDEAVHLSAGYSYLKTGDFRLNPEHPPLSKMSSALPLLWLHPDFAPSPRDWEHADQWAVGKSFLYANRISADRMLMAGRTMTIGLSLL